MSTSNKQFVVIGGGTGSFTLLSGLKNYATNITALVNMSDNGGSSGILRDELGVLPPGDVRQCLVALSGSQKLRELFNYRFNEGSLEGHSFGNLFLSAVEKMTDSFEEAVSMAGQLLHITGRVLPITLTDAHLVLYDDDGNTIRGEYEIGNMHFGPIRRPRIVLDPEAEVTSHARQAILDADVVVIAPGNLYGSIAPALLVNGVGKALRQTKAKIVYACNLVTKPHQTDDFSVTDYADEIERFIGGKALNYVIYNTDEPTPAMLSKYTHDGEFIVEFDLDELSRQHYKAIGLPLVDTKPIDANQADAIAHVRSLIRHDSDALSREIMKISIL